ncbi:MAG: GDSL-type esterase/lipase family protein [Clostridia bacterium]|nr:GDSL-type esterase/lipase family protein [Clostridia bacterium]
MIYKNIEVHGASEVYTLLNGADAFLRVPSSVDMYMGDQGKRMNRGATGIELRFVITEGTEAVFTLCTPTGTGTNATLYYGDFASDWPETTKRIEGEPTEVVIRIPGEITKLRSIAKQYGHRFSPDVVRVILDGPVAVLKTPDNVVPPMADQVPKKVYLAYGSSITHGSIALSRAYEYVNRIGEELGCDAYNYGFAGAACLEPAMADYLAAQNFDIATLEMGINILGIAPEDFEGRVRRFLSIIADSHPNAVIFAIDVFYCVDDYTGRGHAARFREITERVVRELARPNVVYVNGCSILPDARFLTTGLVHPAPRGIMQMTENLLKVIAEHL